MSQPSRGSTRKPFIDTGIQLPLPERLCYSRKNTNGDLEGKKDYKVEKLQFEEEDVPSLNPETGEQNQPYRPTGTPSGVWENTPSAKQLSKMPVIKKVSKEDPAAVISAAFNNSGSHHANWKKVSTMVPSDFENLVPKPMPLPSKPNAWKANRMEHKSGSLSSSWESAFTTNPISVTKPVTLAAGDCSKLSQREFLQYYPSGWVQFLSPDQTDQIYHEQEEFLKTLKDDQNGACLESRDCDKLGVRARGGEEGSHT